MAMSPNRTTGAGALLASLALFGLLAASGTGTGTPTFDRTPPARQTAQAVTGSQTFADAPVRDFAVPTSQQAPPTIVATAGTVPAAVPATAPAVPAPAASKWLPTGKGMWIYVPAQTEGGNVDAIVAKAKATGLTHLWVRMGSAWDGFNVAPFVDRLLPAAHAAGIKVIGWDFPKLEPWNADVERAMTMIHHTTPGGHRIDGFSADIETRAEGTRISPEAARDYGAALRAGAGADYLLIATVPRPSKERASFPYAEVVADYDAIAPMVYWLNRQPDTDVVGALRDLAKFNKPVFPVGQAYDGAPEGGRKGVPSPDELNRFMAAARQQGATGVSFWSWQAADQPAWDTIRAASHFQPISAFPQVFSP